MKEVGVIAANRQ
ncbi:hypothetical protein GNZ06_01170 [Aeromonas jandaei]|nr:hypothetical protein [Aeromonas jandaei]